MQSVVKKIETEQAPKAIGPYSQGVAISAAMDLVFVSGQVPIDPATGKLVEGDIRAQTHRVIDNIEAILKASGSGLHQVLRADVFLKEIKRDFTAVNEEYAKRFNGSPAPARQTVQVSELPLGAPIEISCIAYQRSL